MALRLLVASASGNQSFEFTLTLTWRMIGRWRPRPVFCRCALAGKGCSPRAAKCITTLVSNGCRCWRRAGRVMSMSPRLVSANAG